MHDPFGSGAFTSFCSCGVIAETALVLRASDAQGVVFNPPRLWETAENGAGVNGLGGGGP